MSTDSDTESAAVVESLAESAKDDHLDVTVAGHGTVPVYVAEVATEQDGLAGVAKRTVTMKTLDGRTITAHLEHKAHADETTLLFATLQTAADAEPDYVEIDAVDDGAQQHFDTRG